MRRHRRGPRPTVVSVDQEMKETKWTYTKTEYTEEERRLIIAEVVRIAVETVFKNHLYAWGAGVRLQDKGGAIGEALTQVVARIVMDHWMDLFKKKLEENKIKNRLSRKYVDDYNGIFTTLTMGTRWNGVKLEHRPEWEEEDAKNNEDPDRRTMREIRKLSDSLLDFIKMKEDVPANHESGKLPMLDFQVWKEEVEQEDGTQTLLMHEFYEKKMTSKFVIMESSALPKRMKITTLSQEVVRRMRNTSRGVSSQRRGEILSEFMLKLRRSGYSEADRLNICTSGLRGYLRMVRTEMSGGRRVNRPRQDGEHERRMKRLTGKVSWFKTKKRKEDDEGGDSDNHHQRRRPSRNNNTTQREVDTVLFVPHTPNSTMARAMQKAEDLFIKDRPGGKVKMVERAGVSLESALVNKNPWSSMGCQRDECFPCKTKPGQCQRESCTYVIECGECMAGGVRAAYFGESAATLYRRGLSHQTLLNKRDERSVLFDHCKEYHDSEIVEFNMKLESCHDSAFRRQLREATCIEFTNPDIKMNRRGEYGNQRIPRMTVQVAGVSLDDDEHEEEKSDWPSIETRGNKRAPDDGATNNTLCKRRRVTRPQTRQIKTINRDMTGGGRGDEADNNVTRERDDTDDKVKGGSEDTNTVIRRENSEFNQPQVSTTTASSGSNEKIAKTTKYFPLFERKVKKTRVDENTEQSAAAQHNTSTDEILVTKPKEEEIDEQ